MTQQNRALEQQPLLLWHQGPISGKTVFPQARAGVLGALEYILLRGHYGGVWFRDDSRAVHLLCPLFL